MGQNGIFRLLAGNVSRQRMSSERYVQEAFPLPGSVVKYKNKSRIWSRRLASAATGALETKLQANQEPRERSGASDISLTGSGLAPEEQSLVRSRV